MYGAGEEISWGQRIFDYPTPDILREINSQNEMTLHNIGSLVDIRKTVLLYGTSLLWTMAIANLLYRKNRVFGISRIISGQYTEEGRLWDVEIPFQSVVRRRPVPTRSPSQSTTPRRKSMQGCAYLSPP